MLFLVCSYDVLFIADNQAINKETDLQTHNTVEVSQFSSLLGNFLSFFVYFEPPRRRNRLCYYHPVVDKFRITSMAGAVLLVASK